jgi:hypothetical protein
MRFRACYVIELPPGAVKTTGTQAGDQLKLRKVSPEGTPATKPEPAIGR